jgi:predicted ArsR family transcriptional regulator
MFSKFIQEIKKFKGGVYRKTDPATSRQASTFSNRAKTQYTVLMHLTKYRPRVASEIGEILEIPTSRVTSALAKLNHAGLAKPNGNARPPYSQPTARNQREWVITAKGAQFALNTYKKRKKEMENKEC